MTRSRAWIATSPNGETLHIAEAQGWVVEQVIGPFPEQTAARLSAEAEPIAWMYTHNVDGRVAYMSPEIARATKAAGRLHSDVWTGIPLYAALPDDRDAERWRAFRAADDTLTLRLHNARPDHRDAVIDKAIAARSADSTGGKA